MNDRSKGRSCRYRVWIVAYRHWQPPSCSDVPPDAVALEPAEEGTLSAPEAARYVEAFNRAVLGGRRRIWAVAIPIGGVWYEGEPRPGQPMPDAGGGFSLPVSRRCPPGPAPASARVRPPVPPCSSGGA
ncbi:MAG TPA: hypothetical protein VMY37_02570 [Thermoguttaceae bacterium]|nr:hypothetical protein [Thermoguttaceae bacterium]